LSRWRLAFRRLVQSVLLLSVSGIIALVLAEVLVRLFAPQQLIQIRPDLWMPADSVGWLRRPNATVRINTGERGVSVYSDAEGYRVGQGGRREAPVRVLLLGDSFMEALQVDYEQSTAALLEQGLSERLRRGVAVRNAGVAGWSPNQYLIRARQLLARDTFDLVVVAIFVGNDAVSMRIPYLPPREAVRRHSLRLPRRLAWSEFTDALLKPLNDALEVRSHLYTLLKNQLATVRMRLGMTADYLPIQYQRTEASSPRWQITAELSRDLAAAARARGTPALFVLVPERIQVYEEDFQRHLRGFNIDSTTVDIDQPTMKLRETLGAQQLNVLDALPAFRASAHRGPRLFGIVDQHLSPDGHRVLADTLAVEAARLMTR